MDLRESGRTIIIYRCRREKTRWIALSILDPARSFPRLGCARRSPVATANPRTPAVAAVSRMYSSRKPEGVLGTLATAWTSPWPLLRALAATFRVNYRRRFLSGRLAGSPRLWVLAKLHHRRPRRGQAARRRDSHATSRIHGCKSLLVGPLLSPAHSDPRPPPAHLSSLSASSSAVIVPAQQDTKKK